MRYVYNLLSYFYYLIRTPILNNRNQSDGWEEKANEKKNRNQVRRHTYTNSYSYLYYLVRTPILWFMIEEIYLDHNIIPIYPDRTPYGLDNSYLTRMSTGYI
jgi:hypothetical protein